MNESRSPAAPAGDGFCDGIAGIGDDISAADLSAEWNDDPKGYVDRLAAAAQRFTTVKPPEEIAAPWQAMGEFFTMADNALEGVDATDPVAIEKALKFEGEEAFTLVVRLPGQTEMVGEFVQEKCGVDLGITPAVIADVCDALDPTHIGSVFGGAVPEGENRRWGKGVVECMWNDGDKAEVGIVVGPADAIRPELVQGQKPIDAVKVDSGKVDVYDGALGPLRSASGRTAVTEVGETAVLASVRTGRTDADESKAVALAGLIAEDIE